MGAVHPKARHSDYIKSHLSEERREKPDLNINIPVRVDKIHVNGLARTKDDIVKRSVKELFKARDFREVMLRTHSVTKTLDFLGCFTKINVSIDVSKGPDATKDGLEITFDVSELKRLKGNINTAVGNNEGCLVVALKYINMFGRGEGIHSEYTYGMNKTSNFNLQFVKPFVTTFNSKFTTSIYQTMSEWPWSGYKQVDRGLLLDYGFNSIPMLKHNIQWDACVRDLSVMSRTTSFHVREQSGLSLKSSLRHILQMDQRNGKIFPTEGAFVQLTTELAGFGGDVGFLRNELHAQTNAELLEDVVLQVAFQTGFIKPTNIDKKITMSDQFFLGGPLNLRGFQTRGVGPHSDGNALGSDVYWSGALHLYTHLPFRPGRGGFGDLFRTHWFINAGNVGQLKLDNLEETYNRLKDNVRVAYGLGLAVRVAHIARIELNYCFPLSYQRGDHIHPGVQFGIGVQFL